MGLNSMSQLKLTAIQRNILRDGLKSGGSLQLFTIYRRYPLSPAYLLKQIDRLEQLEFFRIDELTLQLTDKGLESAMVLTGMSDDQPWKKWPKDFDGNTIETGAPYVPKISILDTNFFNSLDTDME